MMIMLWALREWYNQREGIMDRRKGPKAFSAYVKSIYLPNIVVTRVRKLCKRSMQVKRCMAVDFTFRIWGRQLQMDANVRWCNEATSTRCMETNVRWQGLNLRGMLWQLWRDIDGLWPCFKRCNSMCFPNHATRDIWTQTVLWARVLLRWNVFFTVSFHKSWDQNIR